MRKVLIVLMLAAGCGASDHAGGNQASETRPQPAAASSLTGLYEGGPASAPNQLCVVDRKGAPHFGMVVWGANLASCSGAGVIERDGDRLSLKMTGEQACTLPAHIAGGTVTIDRPGAPGCNYYCGAQARFDGASFARKGGTAADALKAKDLAGDPLCG